MRQTILQQAARISKSKTGKIDLLTLWLRRLLVWLVPIVRRGRVRFATESESSPRYLHFELKCQIHRVRLLRADLFANLRPANTFESSIFMIPTFGI